MSKIIGIAALGLVGLLMVIGGAIFLTILPNIIENKVERELRLINGTDAYDRWQKLPVPLTIKFYIFALNNSKTYTNLDDIQLVERGPYVFEENRSKENIVFNTSDKYSVSYRERRQYKFREDLSVGPYDDNIIFINIPLLGVIFNEILTEGKMGFELYKDELDDNEKSLFTTRTVGQLLFDGIDMKLFTLLEPLVPEGSGISLTPFSLFKTRSDLGEEMSIFSDTETDTFGQIFRYANKSQLRNDDSTQSLVWPYHQDLDNTCNELKGTDATYYEPSIHKSDILYTFEPQICRPIFFKYLMETEVKDIRTLRFQTPKEVYESPLKYKQNSCYCLKKNISECDSNGIMEISRCLSVSRGAPVVLSKPYFLSGDSHLRDDIRLVPPKQLKYKNYGTFIDIEPMTGISLKAMKRLQLNIRISNSDALPQLNATKPGKDYIIPVLWLEESAELTEDLADDLKRKVITPKKLATGASIASMVIGVFLIMITCYLTVTNFKVSW